MNIRPSLRGLASASIIAVLVPLGATAGVLALGAGPAAAASTWYVAPGGAPAAPCGATKAHPCASIGVAIAEASAGDAIRLAKGTYTAATTAGLVSVTKNLTLTGAGRADTVLNGNKLGTVLTVSPGVTAAVSSVTVKGGTGTAMTIEGDAAQAGGGILNQGKLALKNVAVTGNHVTATAVGDNFVSAFGGGVFNADGGTLTVSGSVIKGNSVSASTAGADQ